MLFVSRPVTDRFWEKVDKHGPTPQHCPELGACWVWTAQTDKEGYGRFSLNGKKAKAHRMAYMLAHGPIPDKLLVCHKCDNPSCVNANHLFIGSNLDNTRDCVAKKRHVTQRANSYKLTLEAATEIRRLHSQEGLGYRRLARMYQVGRSTIQDAVKGRSWSTATPTVQHRPTNEDSDR